MQSTYSARRETPARGSRSHARFLAEVSRVLANSLDYETTLAAVAGLALPYIGGWCVVDLASPDGSMSRLAVLHPDPAKQALARQLERGWPPHLEDPLGVPIVTRTGKSEVITHVTDEMLVHAAHTPENLQILRQMGIGSLIVVPLLARERVLGAITFISALTGHQYTDDDLALAEDLASRAALAIDNARLYWDTVQAKKAAEEDRNRLLRLQELTSALSRSRTPEEVGRAAVSIGSGAYGAQGGFVGMVNADGDALEGVQSVGYPPGFRNHWTHVPMAVRVPITEAARTGQPLFFSSRAERDVRFPETPGPDGFEAVASAPLIAGGRTLGAWTLHFVEPREFSAADRAFLATMTEQCAQALERARLYTEAQNAQAEAQAANQAKSMFLAATSHEIRTPINAIVGYAQLLEMGLYGPVNDAQRAQLERINASSQHLLGLVNEVLDLAKVEAGQLTVQREKAELEEAISAATAIVYPRLLERSMALVQLCHDPHTGGYIGDPDRVRQILINLLGNAVKFTQPGGQITVRCEVTREVDPATRLAADGAWTVLHVEDTGMGISPEDQERIFEPFVQARGGLTRTEGGTGLGLAISRQLARLMGGDLTVQSTVGQGSRFSLWLPASGAVPVTPDNAQPTEDADPTGLEGIGALILERVDAILDRYLDLLRSDSSLKDVATQSDVDLRNHTLSFLTTLAQSVSLAGDRKRGAEENLRDGSKIQRIISELHGAQRRRLGWSEEALRRDIQLLQESVDAEVRQAALMHGATEENLGVLEWTFDQAERTSVRAWQVADRQ